MTNVKYLTIYTPFTINIDIKTSTSQSPSYTNKAVPFVSQMRPWCHQPPRKMPEAAEETNNGRTWFTFSDFNSCSTTPQWQTTMKQLKDYIRSHLYAPVQCTIQPKVHGVFHQVTAWTAAQARVESQSQISLGSSCLREHCTEAPGEKKGFKIP